jgi:lipid-A-disaccharide synthase
MVLHFGGELLLSVALARRLGVPIMAYEEERVRWASLLDRVCVRDARAASHTRHGHVRVVGNLMVDAAHLRVPGRATAQRRGQTLALFPGSRPYFVQQLLPLFLRVAGALRQRRPAVRVVLAKSDFISHRELADCLADRSGRVVEGDDGRVHRTGDRVVIESERGVRVEVLAPDEAMSRADLAVTIPGTNTAELGSLGIPMLLVLPTYRLHALPLPGLAGHLGGVPFLGPLIKEGVARTYVRARRFWAHPNRLAGELIVPELVGRLTSEQIAAELDGLLDRPPQWTEERLRAVMGAPGASARLLDEVLDLLQSDE